MITTEEFVKKVQSLNIENQWKVINLMKEMVVDNEKQPQNARQE